MSMRRIKKFYGYSMLTSFRSLPFQGPKSLDFQGPPLFMALVMDLHPRGQYGVYLLRTATPPPPALQSEINIDM